jgi:hypothetical protein
MSLCAVAFSRTRVVYLYDRVDPAKAEKAARHWRSNTAWPKIGIFAQRGKNRASSMRTTICCCDRIEELQSTSSALMQLREGLFSTSIRGLRVRPARRKCASGVWMAELMSGLRAMQRGRRGDPERTMESLLASVGRPGLRGRVGKRARQTARDVYASVAWHPQADSASTRLNVGGHDPLRQKVVGAVS